MAYRAMPDLNDSVILLLTKLKSENYENYPFNSNSDARFIGLQE
jgi:hypothetical protein